MVHSHLVQKTVAKSSQNNGFSSRMPKFPYAMQAKTNGHLEDKEKRLSQQGSGGMDFNKIAILPTSSISVQPKLKINAAGDKYEQQADRMAQRVMSMPGKTIQRKCTKCEEEAKDLSKPKIQRKCAKCEEEEVIQTKSNGNFEGMASVGLTHQIENAKGGGQTMDANTLSFMESRFGTDFKSVKIHTGNQASQMNREINAKAFTVGKDIYFDDGQYNPSSSSGKLLLAHELTHTLQQQGLQRKMVQRACVNGSWRYEFDGCSLPGALEWFLGIDKDNPAGGPDTQFGSTTGRNQQLPCDKHDICYQTCGSNRGTCDYQMFVDMIAVCNNSRASNQIKESCRDWAGEAYAGLIQFGEAAFEERQEQSCGCN